MIVGCQQMGQIVARFGNGLHFPYDATALYIHRAGMPFNIR